MLLLTLTLMGCRYLDNDGCSAGEAEGYTHGYSDVSAGCPENPNPDRVDQAMSGSGKYAASYEACYRLGYEQGYREGNATGDGSSCPE